MRLTVLALLMTASLAGAHDVPVDPNTCTFDPLEIGAAVVAPPTGADALRIVYTVASNIAQFQAATVPARAFTIGGVEGSLAFPAVFATTLTTAGDLVFAPVPLAFVVDGVPITVPVALTTGLVASDGGVLAGTPIGDGVLGLVGIVPAGTLPAPLDGATVVRMQCLLLPVAPDLDQFAEAAAAAKLGGFLKATKGKLHAVLEVPVGTTPDFARPAMLRLATNDGDLVVVDLPNGLVANGRKHTGTAADGSVVTVKPGKKKPRPTYKVLLTTPGQTVAAPAGGQADVQATFDLGGVLARGARTFKAKSGGLRAP